MASGREEYSGPVWFAREPVAERRRWISRILLLVIVVFLAWLLITKVIHPPDDSHVPSGQESTLPAPV